MKNEAKQAEIVPAASVGMTHPVPTGGLDVGAIMAQAIEKGLGVDALERLVALQERAEARAASAQFGAAMAAFQAECPPIPKSSVAEIRKDGILKASYRYAELDAIARVVNPILARVGLSYTWSSTIDASGLMTCTCRVRHAAGHAEESSFACPIDGTALMSPAQKGAAALTFAKRQALVQVLGLTTTEEDTDAAEEQEAAQTITDEQAANLDALLSESPVAGERDRFLKWAKVARVSDLPASMLAESTKVLLGRRKAGWPK
jgi:hypothetical protein